MDETCDGCAPPKPAVYLVVKGDAMLTLCAGCGQQHYPGLSAQGWEFSPLTSIAGAPQLSQVPS